MKNMTCSAKIGVLSGLLAGALALPAMAVSISVSNYNWMQLPPGLVGSAVGGVSGGGNGYGSALDIVYANHVWIPNGTMTNNGAASYWAYVKLDQSRPVTTVRTQWWYAEGTGIKKWTIQGSNDGLAWSDLGSTDLGSMQVNGSKGFWDTPVTSNAGSYQYVRVYVAPSDYQYGSASRGGPGIYTIEPVAASATLDSDLVNWANKPSFSTVASISNFTRGSTVFNSGWTDNTDNPLSGNDTSPWPTTSYGQVDLGTARVVASSLVYFFAGYGGTYKIQYSTDNVNWNYVVGVSAPIQYDGWKAVQYYFGGVNARYFRITDGAYPVGGGQGPLFDQFLLFAPEPASLLLLGLGGLCVLRRRR